MHALRIVPLLLAPLLVGVGLRHFDVGVPELVDAVSALGFAAPVIFLALAAVRPLVGFPSIVFTLTAAVAWGPVVGTLLAVAAATVGGVAAFAAARRIGAARVTTWVTAHPRVERLVAGASFRTLLVARLVPFVPDDPLHYAAGVSRLGVGAFAAATFLGMLPGTAALVVGARAVVGA